LTVRKRSIILHTAVIILDGYSKGGKLNGVGSSKGKRYAGGLRYIENGHGANTEYGNGAGMSYEFAERNHRLAKMDALYCLIQDYGVQL